MHKKGHTRKGGPTIHATKREEISSPEEGYYNLAVAILFLICEEYGYVYQRYARGQTRESILQRQVEYMEDDFTAYLIDILLNDTPEGVMRNIERQVQKDIEEGNSGRYTKLH